MMRYFYLGNDGIIISPVQNGSYIFDIIHTPTQRLGTGDDMFEVLE